MMSCLYNRFWLFLGFFLVLLANTAPLHAQRNGAFSFTFFGHQYTVRPQKPEGTDLEFSAVKSFIPVVFPEYRAEERGVVDTIDFVYSVVAGYQYVYEDGVNILLERLVKEEIIRQSNAQAYGEELKAVFRSGRWKAYSKSFARSHPGIPFHFAVVQEQYARYISALYVYNMLVSSPEGQAAIASKKAQKQEGTAQ